MLSLLNYRKTKGNFKVMFCKRHVLLLCLILLLPFSKDANAQYWMQRAGGSTIDEAYSISLDGSDSTYTTGYFSGTATFGKTTLTSSGVSDVFVTKTDKNGNFKWAVKGGGSGSCRGLAIKVDAAGNSYVTGYYYGSATFGSKTITSAGAQDVFIAKYDNQGTLLWVVSAGGAMADIGNAITIDNSGNVLVTGEFAGTATFGTYTLTSVKNNVNVFTTKLDGSGNFLWAKMGSGPHTNRGLGVGCDPSGNVYVTGQFTDTITFDNVHKGSLYNAVFLIKYNSSGNEQWFTMAGGGTANIANGIAVDKNSNIYLTGDFSGTLSFFVSPVVSLTNVYGNKIFVVKYDQTGKLLWDVADGSNSQVTSKAISLDGSGNPYVIGNFECRFNGYADQYGQGTFNSVGYWDIFVAEYLGSTGVWQWSRQIGGHNDNLGYGIAVNSTGDIYTAGSFNQDMIITSAGGYLGYSSNQADCFQSYCSDGDYGVFQYFSTAGSSDIFIAKPIDLSRQPYDFYTRNGSICTRPVVSVCINNNCPDSVTFCESGYLNAISNTCSQVGPNFNYKWSTGVPYSGMGVTKSGWYSVTQTSADGCLQTSDSIYVVINPNPQTPTITDNVVININSQHPAPITVCQKSVILTGGGYGANSYSWSTGATTQSITVTSSGEYCFTVTNKKGCDSTTCVRVDIEDSLPKIKPAMICEGCKHDSIAFCKGSSFKELPFDSISNPAANPVYCIPPGSPYITNYWFAKPKTVSFVGITGCPLSDNSFTPSDSGWYYITDSIVRANICDTLVSVLHDSVYVTLYPIPSDSALSIKGKNVVCPGDSTWLVAVGTGYTWSTGSTKDSIWVGTGAYSITSMVTNKYGCSASSAASIYVSTKTPPSIFITPNNGTICPGDSLFLTCSGSGSFQWQGPTGVIAGNSSSIYVKTPGFYYCVLTDTAFCAPILSNTAQVNLYATPYMVASPNPAICPGDSVRLRVISSTGSVIQWLPPLSGSDSVQIITTPGVYTCKITCCGIVTNCSQAITMSNPLATIAASGPETFCAGDSVTLTANNGEILYVWEPGGINSQTIIVKTPGTYTLITTNADGCSARDTAKIIVTPDNIKPPLVADTNVCPGSVAILSAATSGSVAWYATPVGGTALYKVNPFTTPEINNVTVYYVEQLVGDCRSLRDSVRVDTTNCDGEYIPNVFTPNGDGSNDVFKVIIKDAKCFDGKIYNRWGVLVYQWGDALKGWDGVIMQTNLPASDGVYYYIINYCTYLGAPGTKYGFLTLIR